MEVAIGSITWRICLSLGNSRSDYNEGHSGYNIDAVSGQASKSLLSRPKVVLLHAGTNDLNRRFDPPGAPAASWKIDRQDPKELPRRRPACGQNHSIKETSRPE